MTFVEELLDVKGRGTQISDQPSQPNPKKRKKNQTGPTQCIIDKFFDQTALIGLGNGLGPI